MRQPQGRSRTNTLRGLYNNKEGLKNALKEAVKKKTPAVIECMIQSEEIVLPMVKSGNPMTEMILK